MEFNTNNVIIYFTLVILVILVIYILVKQKKNSNSTRENFDTTNINFDTTNINTDAINNLGLICAQIMNSTTGTLTIPNNVNITGNLSAATFNLLPAGIVVSYNSIIAPTGWALCDGTIPIGGTTNTPDLRGRFILGYYNSNTNTSVPPIPATKNISTNKLNQINGSENITLQVGQIPYFPQTQTGGNITNLNPGPYGGTSNGGTQGGTSINIMPPYYVLVYIIKL